MLMRAMGSIWTATFSFMGGARLGLWRWVLRVGHTLASNAANRWRGRRRGAIRMASKRRSNSRMLGMRHQPGLRGVDDARLLARRHRLGGVIEAGAALTSTKTSRLRFCAQRGRSRHRACGSAGPGCDSPWPSDRRRRGSRPKARCGRPRRVPARRAASVGVAPSVFAIAASCLLRQLERAGIDLAARPARKLDRMRDASLTLVLRQRRSRSRSSRSSLRHDLSRRRAAGRSPARIRRASPACRHALASSATGARVISSCSLVSSRQIAASRPPMMSARSASVSCTRLPDSNSTSVASIRASSAEPRPPRALLRRQEALEEEAVGRQRRDRERRQHRGRAGHRDHAVAGGAGLAHQLEAGIGDQRRAGVGHQRDRCALRQLLQDLRPRAARRCARDRV